MITNSTSLAAFVIMRILVELTPGPNMAWLALTSAREGRRARLAAVGGMALGLALVAVAIVFGLAGLKGAAPLLFDLLRFAGTAYMLWIAWQTWQGASETSPVRTETQKPLAAHFRHGLALNILNPKAASFFVAILPTFVAPGHPGGMQLGALSAVYVAIATAVHIGIVLAAGGAHAWLNGARGMQTVSRIFAVMIAGVAIWMLTSTGEPA